MSIDCNVNSCLLHGEKLKLKRKLFYPLHIQVGEKPLYAYNRTYFREVFRDLKYICGSVLGINSLKCECMPKWSKSAYIL